MRIAHTSIASFIERAAASSGTRTQQGALGCLGANAYGPNPKEMAAA
ncbi:MAG: hypothetical protein KGN02_00660 [bacterium]|nr:hypothetical protein [bacterium]